MMNSKVLAGAAVSVIIAGGFALWIATQHANIAAASGEEVRNGSAIAPTTGTTYAASASAPDPSRLVDQLALEMLENYGDSIDSKVTQAALLKLRQRVLKSHPQRGDALFRQAVQTAFPELADGILEIVTTMGTYQSWLADNRLDLDELALLKRQAVIWNKRHQLFGPDADVIWAKEKQAQIAKRQTMQAVYQRLDQSNGTLDEQLFQLDEAIAETYGYTVKSIAIESGSIAQAYFGFDSVQQRLKDLPAEKRQQEINRLRKKMGYTDAQTERLAKRDQKREKRWERGHDYMAQRQSLTERYSGDELRDKLDTLRKKVFTFEAKTIALEEQDGFFRYERRRLYGRN